VVLIRNIPNFHQLLLRWKGEFWEEGLGLSSLIDCVHSLFEIVDVDIEDESERSRVG
jgi:hypothetical protein